MKTVLFAALLMPAIASAQYWPQYQQQQPIVVQQAPSYPQPLLIQQLPPYTQLPLPSYNSSTGETRGEFEARRNETIRYNSLMRAERGLRELGELERANDRNRR